MHSNVYKGFERVLVCFVTELSVYVRSTSLPFLIFLRYRSQIHTVFQVILKMVTDSNTEETHFIGGVDLCEDRGYREFASCKRRVCGPSSESALEKVSPET